MPGYRAALLNFSKGEVSPEVRARFDLSAYQAAAKRARNVKVRRTGGLYKRLGTRFVAEALSSGSHLIPFQFSDQQAYALEMAQEKMRPFALGGAVLEEGLTITSVASAAAGETILGAAFHNLEVGETVYVSGVTGMVEINDRFFEVIAVIDANHFVVGFDMGLASAFTGDTGGITRTGPPAAPPAPPPTPTPTPDPTPPTIGSGSAGSYDGGGSSPDTGTRGEYRGGTGSLDNLEVP